MSCKSCKSSPSGPWPIFTPMAGTPMRPKHSRVLTHTSVFDPCSMVKENASVPWRLGRGRPWLALWRPGWAGAPTLGEEERNLPFGAPEGGRNPTCNPSEFKGLHVFSFIRI